MCAYVGVCVCMRACVRAYVRACVHVGTSEVLKYMMELHVYL